MKNLQILSDLHFEHHHDEGESFMSKLNPEGVDILVMAGDIAPTHGGILQNAFHEVCKKYKNVVYVSGNHEYYKSSIRLGNDRLSKVKIKNLHILHNEAKTVDGVRFYGGTMWFPEAYDPMTQLAKTRMNDFYQISDMEPECYRENTDFVNKYGLNMTDKTVVLTHHLPSPESTPHRFRRSHLNPFFVCDMQDKIACCTVPQLWIHGHTHDQTDYEMHVTYPLTPEEKPETLRVVANPLAYPGEPSGLQYQEKLVITVKEVNE